MLSIQLATVLPVWWAPVEGRLKALLEVALAHPGNGRLARLHSICDGFIDPARPLQTLVGFEQDPSVGELAGRSGARGDQALELFSFGFGQDNGILFLHDL